MLPPPEDVDEPEPPSFEVDDEVDDELPESLPELLELLELSDDDELLDELDDEDELEDEDERLSVL